MFQNRVFPLGAFAVIFDERGRALFCFREDLSVWNLPGGAVEKEEAPWEAVVREVKEETGLGVRIERVAGVYWRPRESEVAFSFACSIVGGEIIKTWEAVEVRYFAPDRVPEKVNRRHVEMVQDALGFPGETVVRTQSGLSVRDMVERGLL